MTPDAIPDPTTRSPLVRPPARPARKRRKHRSAWPVWLIVITCYLAVVFAFACPQDFRNSSPTYVWTAWTAFMIRTFLFHLGLLWSAIAVAALAWRRWRPLIAALPLVTFCVGPALWSYLPTSKPAVAGQTVTVMSVNLLGRNQNTGPMVAEVLATSPDVLLSQEYRPHWHRAFQQALGDQYPHTSHVQRTDNFGLTIYSRLPFVEPVDMAVPLGTAGTPQARAVLRIAGRDVALYNVHLMPPKGCARTTEQRQEFADLLDRLRREELPVVLCGDFNFTNASAFADELRRLGLVDVHQISGWGRGSTWPMRGALRRLPGIRLDHIFLSRELTSPHSRTGTGQGSDHRPVIAEIGLAQ